ncbi:Hypothetical predicted protein [Pelobates cultripes]|uniref:Uncharacterized protein n=1 Tax=Pelobates cultripes TaxID=61616 RepID=A0AAD1W4W2_PELCU|nr:Hypothetical predicted protein [Pelobates cultripes]
MAKSTSIGPITWSDHAEITLTLNLPCTGRPWSWRLNPILLHNPQIRQSVDRAITDYFQLNKDGAISEGTLWAAHKAVIRGVMINQATKQQKKQVAHLEQTLTTLRTLEAKHKLNPTPDLTEQIKKCQTDIKEFMAKDSTKALLWSKQFFYDKANKADTLLARRLNTKN